MIKEYLPVPLQIGAGVAIALGAVVTSHILGQRAKRTPAKDTPYECGKDPIGSANTRFAVKVYLVAMLFILFDIEVIFLYPWALNYTELLAGPLGIRILWMMMAFILIIEVGHLYAYKKGVFDWAKRRSILEN